MFEKTNTYLFEIFLYVGAYQYFFLVKCQCYRAELSWSMSALICFETSHCYNVKLIVLFLQVQVQRPYWVFELGG